MDKALASFKEYVASFDNKDFNIKLKIEHTYRVVELAKEIASKLNLNAEDTNLLEIIALLHDIGRFVQVNKYHNFSDKKFDHASYGVQYLFEEGHIRDFVIDNKDDAIIKEAIYEHNKHYLDIPPLDKRTKMFVDLIRDIDKIDIFYVDYLCFDLILDEEEITVSCLKDFLNKRLVKKISNLKKSDGLIIDCGYIFDFNYQESIELLKEKGYIDLMLNKIKVINNSEDIFNIIKNNMYEVLNRKEGLKC